MRRFVTVHTPKSVSGLCRARTRPLLALAHCHQYKQRRSETMMGTRALSFLALLSASCLLGVFRA